MEGSPLLGSGYFTAASTSLLAMTLRGTNIAGEFEALVTDYIEQRFGRGQAAAESQEHEV